MSMLPIEMAIPSNDTHTYQPNSYEPDRENSILDSDSDWLSDLPESNENIGHNIRRRSPHVIKFKAPEFKATNTVGSKKVSKDARHAVKKRREPKKGEAKDGTSISGSKKYVPKTVSNLKSESPARGRSRERSGKFSFIRRPLSLKKSSKSNSDSCFGCNTDGISVLSGSTTGSRVGSRFLSRLSPFSSRLGPFRRSKSRDSVGSASSRGRTRWRKWRKSKNRRNRTPEKKLILVEKVSPVDVSDFVESTSRVNRQNASSWLCASMEPVILCKDYFCANEDEEDLIGKVIGSENDKLSGILRNGPKNYVRFEENEDYEYDYR